MAPSPPQTGALFQGAENGHPGAASELLPVASDELRRLEREISKGRPGRTLQATQLVPEAYLRLARKKHVAWNGTWTAEGAWTLSRARLDCEIAKVR